METKDLHKLFLKSSGVSTDSRKIENNALFFALKGPHFNGNHFAETAMEKGASHVVIDEPPQKENPRFILVEDVLNCLQTLATFHRNFLKTPILALTGSNGKTTTKELLNTVLSKKYKTLATKGNLNNPIGVPLTLLSLNKKTEIGIIEMGANHPGEIAFLCELAQPDFGYITNFGKAHLEGFKSLEGVIKAKSELYHYIKTHDKTLFLNLDDPNQKKQLPYPKYWGFGITENADVTIKYPPSSPFAQIQVGKAIIDSRLPGKYNAQNMAAAFAIGSYFEIPSQKICQALENYVPTNNRSQVITKNSNKIILDAYNANPTSMEAALENFKTLPGTKKMVILGDMFELGEVSEEEHQKIVKSLQASKIDRIYLIGKHFFKTQTKGNIKKFKSFEDFKTEFDSAEIKSYLILIKGSRGMALERGVECF